MIMFFIGFVAGVFAFAALIFVCCLFNPNNYATQPNAIILELVLEEDKNSQEPEPWEQHPDWWKEHD